MVHEMEEMVEVMRNAGINEKCTMCLIALKDNEGGLTSLDIQKLVRLRQPDISVSLSWLKANDWIDSSLIRRTGRGRPHYNYMLAKPFDQIIQDIIGFEAERICDIQENLVRLRDIASR